VVADAVAEGLIARSGGKAGAETAEPGAEEPLAEWERELLGGDAEKAAVEATGGDAATDETPASEATGASTEAVESTEAAEAAAPAADEAAAPAADEAAPASDEAKA